MPIALGRSTSTATTTCVYIQEHLVETVACLQKDKRNPQNQVAVVTFKSQRKGWADAEPGSHGRRRTIKTTLSIEERREIS